MTAVNINALTITTSWQGFYGNVSGEITLDDSAGNTFYNWSLTDVDGEVYATRTNSADWAAIACATSGQRVTEETYLGQVAADGDSVTNTFNFTTHPAFNASTSVMGVDSCYSTRGYVNSAQSSTDWYQILLYDGTNTQIVYSTLMNASATGFDGTPYDFQLLVGENEKAGSIGSTDYYFWVELN
ncbi:hypothetical protein GOV11_03095 [Candidatus Woesearchaeota archaeon]|nr:hypothetical protein [Candidatus Woesearchaeota archaeon]